ncbi:MAG: DUF4280 domain-containing protein [Eubacterium sp.]|jgi:hypothetical protein|nr:DUF4280 domain-containing protein [Eubacterium sp.]
MAKEPYVVSGAKVSCSMGTVDAPLRVTPGCFAKANGKERANIMDCVPMLNIGPFGVCKMTKVPCVPACGGWIKGKYDVLVHGMPALLKSSMAVCPVAAGIIKIKDDGQ